MVLFLSLHFLYRFQGSDLGCQALVASPFYLLNDIITHIHHFKRQDSYSPDWPELTMILIS